MQLNGPSNKRRLYITLTIVLFLGLLNSLYPWSKLWNRIQEFSQSRIEANKATLRKRNADELNIKMELVGKITTLPPNPKYFSNPHLAGIYAKIARTSQDKRLSKNGPPLQFMISNLDNIFARWVRVVPADTVATERSVEVERLELVRDANSDMIHTIVYCGKNAPDRGYDVEFEYRITSKGNSGKEDFFLRTPNKTLVPTTVCHHCLPNAWC